MPTATIERLGRRALRLATLLHYQRSPRDVSLGGLELVLLNADPEAPMFSHKFAHVVVRMGSEDHLVSIHCDDAIEVRSELSINVAPN
jgi:hypothetical protein